VPSPLAHAADSPKANDTGLEGPTKMEAAVEALVPPPSDDAEVPAEHGLGPNTDQTSPAAVAPELPQDAKESAARADKLLKGDLGQKQQGLEVYRALGKAHPEHPTVLEGWSRAAAANKWWGEALRAALRWASLDSSARAQLYLARTQRLVGQRYGAIQTLERLLSKEPGQQEAQAMLERYRAR
jgi:hypothetical protein